MSTNVNAPPSSFLLTSRSRWLSNHKLWIKNLFNDICFTHIFGIFFFHIQIQWKGSLIFERSFGISTELCQISLIVHMQSSVQQHCCRFSCKMNISVICVCVCLCVCSLGILRDSLEVVNCMWKKSPWRHKIVLNFTSNTFQTGECK